MPNKFTHLHVHSHYSLLDGLGKINELVAKAAELGMDSLALTDHGALYGAIEFYQKAKKAGIKPIIGCEMYIAADKMRDKRPGIDDKRYHLTVLSQNNEGYKNLINLVSAAHLEGFYYKPRVDKEELKKYSAGLIALSGCFNGEIPRAIQSGKMKMAEELIRQYQEIFGKDNFYLELGAHFNYADQKVTNDGLVELSRITGAKLVATNDIHYVNPEDAEAQDILVSVQTGAKIQDEDRLTMRGANLSMRSPDEMTELFRDLPEAIDNTQEIASKCDVKISLGENQLPHYPVPAGFDADSYLKKLCEEGLSKRYKEPSKNIINRLKYELAVISQTGFASYFLIVQDFVNWAKNSGIVVGPGRGSAAGSLASYLLGITNIDPIKYNLLFERFLNPERISMPDIDLDFADTRRDEVIEYVSKKYGRDHVAQIITFGTMAARAAIRDTGRALGYPYSFCDQIAKMIPFNPTQGEKTGWLKKCLLNVPELKAIYSVNPDAKRLIDSALKLEGVARHASTHACGVVVAPKPLKEYLPLQYAVKRQKSKNNAEREQALVTQYEMHAIEDLGLLKMDFLGLRNLTIIENTLALMKKLHGVEINTEKIPLDDEKTFRLFQEGKTTGLFQFESSGMKRYLRELKPTELEDLIAMVSLYRPGPMELIPSYIKRKHGQERVYYLHPKLEPILKNTHGIGVYQEQMMQIARDLAGFTLPEADTLRKAIGKKIKTLLAEQKEKLISGMLKNGITQQVADQIWELFPPFARYGFNRSHAACYALIAYQTGYLKAHFPTEFMANLMTAEGFETERAAELIEEAREIGIDVLPPDVNESFENFTVVSDKKRSDAASLEIPSLARGKNNLSPAGSLGVIRFGLNPVKNVGENIVEAIIRTRKSGGRFASLTDFLERVAHKDLNKKSLESLIRCGALDNFGERNQLLANIETLLEYSRSHEKNKLSGQISLFGASPELYSSSINLVKTEPALKKDKLLWEKELLGLYVTEHPLQEYAEKLKLRGSLPLKNLNLDLRGQKILVGGIISGIKKIITKSGESMLFVKLEDLTARTEVLVFPRVLSQNPNLWREDKILMIRGRLSDKDGEPKILCEEAVEVS